jgi:hypothetical protein
MVIKIIDLAVLVLLKLVDVGQRRKLVERIGGNRKDQKQKYFRNLRSKVKFEVETNMVFNRMYISSINGYYPCD